MSVSTYVLCPAGDPDLKEWVKVPEPFLADDMSGLPTHCFRWGGEGGDSWEGGKRGQGGCKCGGRRARWRRRG